MSLTLYFCFLKRCSTSFQKTAYCYMLELLMLSNCLGWLEIPAPSSKYISALKTFLSRFCPGIWQIFTWSMRRGFGTLNANRRADLVMLQMLLTQILLRFWLLLLLVQYMKKCFKTLTDKVEPLSLSEQYMKNCSLFKKKKKELLQNMHILYVAKAMPYMVMHITWKSNFDIFGWEVPHEWK